MNKRKFFLSLKVQLLLFCLVVFLPILYIINNLYNTHTKDLLYQETKSKLIHIANLASEEFKINSIISLSKSKNIKSKEYNEIKNEILNLKSKIEGLKNISIIVKKDNDEAFYLTDINDKTKDINRDGKITEFEGLILVDENDYNTKINTEAGLEEGFDKVTMSPVIYTDISGSWLRAYSPVRGSNSNNSAVIAVDMYINNISEKHNKSVTTFRNTIIFSFLVVLLLFLLASLIFLAPINKLRYKVKNFKASKFDSDVKSSWLYGEIGELVESVNDMSHELKKYYDKEAVNKGELVEKQKVMEMANVQIKAKNYQLNDTIVKLNSINVLVEELISIKDTKELMETVLPSTIKLVNANKGFILEYLPEQGNFQVISSFNMKKINEGDIITLEDGIYLKKIFETKNYVNIDKKCIIRDEDFDTALVFPLLVEKDLKGVMYILDKTKPANLLATHPVVNEKDSKTDTPKENDCYFVESDESTVRTLSKLVAAVWESIHLFELATIDNLSKLYVRRYFEKSIEEEIRKASRNNTKIGLMMIDIDNLQKCNENYGYFVGDQVIRQTAEQIKETIDDDALAARYAGEKFVVFIPEKDIDETINSAESIRNNIEDMEIQVPIGENLKVTASIGVAVYPDNGETLEELLKEIEESLYRAKREGKNRVIANAT